VYFERISLSRKKNRERERKNKRNQSIFFQSKNVYRKEEKRKRK